MSFVIITNKREGMIYGPRSAAGGAVFVFKPGANEVPQEYLEGLDEHGQAVVEDLFAAGYLSADLPEDAPMQPNHGVAPASELPAQLPEDADKALAAVLAEGDRKVLSGWLENEHRENVFDALITRLAALDGGSTLKG